MSHFYLLLVGLKEENSIDKYLIDERTIWHGRMND